MAFQAAPSQLYNTTFFDEAIVPSSFHEEAACGLPPSSLQCHDSNKVLPSALPTIDMPQKKPQRPCHKKQTQLTQLVPGAAATSAAAAATTTLKPKRRGRKPKMEDQEEPHDGYVQPGADVKDPRRRRILERNRIAATKCRLRKRDEASALASREQAMEDQNRYLSSCFDDLTAEIYHLKTQLLRHTDCNCVLIQKYIANEARRSVDGLVSTSMGFQDNGMPRYSHRGSTVSCSSVSDSLPLHIQDLEAIPPPEVNVFQPGAGSSDGGEDDMFEMMMMMGSAPKRQMPAFSQPISSMPVMTRCETAMFAGLDQQPQLVEGMHWNSWEFR